MDEATSRAATTPLPDPAGFLAFSGSRDRLSDREMYVWLEYLKGLGDWKGFVTGGCVGFDDFVGRTLVDLFPTHGHVIYVPSDRSRVAPWWDNPKYKPFVEVRYMAAGTTYRDRDAAMVDHAAALVAKPKHPEGHPNSLRSGTWLTVRLARKAMKPFVINPVNP